VTIEPYLHSLTKEQLLNINDMILQLVNEKRTEPHCIIFHVEDYWGTKKRFRTEDYQGAIDYLAMLAGKNNTLENNKGVPGYFLQLYAEKVPASDYEAYFIMQNVTQETL
jgi:hypothetical protein